MANHQSDYAKGIRQMPVAGGSELVSIRLVVALPATHALNDIVEFGELPEDHVPVDFILDSADLDTNGAPAIVLSVGLLNAGKTDISTAAADGGAAWLTGSNIGQAGGMARPTVRALWTTQPSSTTRRMLGAKITTGAATAAAGNLALTIKYRAAAYSE
jgi:hypothetical protein